MAVAVGVDVAKEFHWAALVHSETGRVLASRKVDNDPSAIQVLIDDIRAAQAEHGPATVAIDVLGGIAGLLQVMLVDAGLRLVHVSGLAVNRARRGTRGGEHKSDPRDAKVIADQIRLRADELRPVEPATEADSELRLLVGRRRELVVDQTRRISRLRDLLASIHPGLERVVDPTHKVDAALLARYVTPAEIRRAGRRRISEYLRTTGRHNSTVIDALVDKALTAAGAQHVTVPGETVAADIVRDLAREALACRDKLADLDKRILKVLDRHPDAALIQSLPGMGATLTAEFLAVAGGITRFATGDQLASAAGLAPVLHQSGKVHYLRRATSGDKTLKRVFYQSAFCALQRDPASRAFYDRKRAEGKRHHQALIALARRRINVLHALLRTRQPYRLDHPLAA
ncbi:IS110 family transposase [Micromonospora thermarum]|uniref:IS110 family transposase n=1 Tax=Micromonospora thermarum TaxID=2720024 RepID=A0ABX0ZIW7_9ACTN|nr:IS110 family transposase [Micromonospora thermarum]NJP35775.1 IS110 family transposase [Micromonospora thermarum]